MDSSDSKIGFQLLWKWKQIFFRNNCDEQGNMRGNMRECFSHREPPSGGRLLPYDINTGTKSAACGLVCSEACDVQLSMGV